MPDSHYSAWIVKADNDLLNIENNLMGERIPWDTVCFHAQQAAEKALKGLLVHKEHTPPRTHDLVALLARCVAFEPGLSDLEQECRRLSAYAVGSRYPDDFFEPDPADALEMVYAARRVKERVVSLLPGFIKNE